MSTVATSAATLADAAPRTTPYRLFDLALARREQLSPHMARLTFTSPDVARMTTIAPDQRIKIFFPNAAGEAPSLAGGADWYAHYRQLPAEARPPMRTYTIRKLRAAACEVDVDFVLHGDNGPASRWATNARAGDRVVFSAPNADHPAPIGGYEWKPTPATRDVLLIGDETALPAIAGILEELAVLPAPPTAQAFIEVPTAQDAIPLATWPGLAVTWLPRDEAAAGVEPMVDAVRRARLPAARGRPAALPDIDLDSQILWDRAAPEAEGFYAWVAGEAAAVLAIRQYLVRDRGMDRRGLNLMGYWRRGGVLD